MFQMTSAVVQGNYSTACRAEGPSISGVATSITLGVHNDRSSNPGPTVLFSGEAASGQCGGRYLLAVLGPTVEFEVKEPKPFVNRQE